MNTDTAHHAAGTITVTYNGQTVSYRVKKAPAYVAVSPNPAWTRDAGSPWVTWHSRRDLAQREATKRGGIVLAVEVAA